MGDIGLGPRILVEFSLFGLCDVKISQTVLSSFLVMIFLIIISAVLGKGLQKRPTKRQVLVEKAKELQKEDPALYQSQALLRAADLEADFSAKGTTVYMVLANDSRKQAKDVFDVYADMDSGFTKTRIPLRNYFERSPVSRSQAKSLCARLEQFENVELDFEGLEWMGQGFAHELFAVFQNEHPDVKLIPVNMNDDVRKMYRHVTKEPTE